MMMRVLMFLLALLLASLSAAAVRAQSPEQSGQPPQVTAPEVSRECRTPGVTMSADVSLPRVARSLKERKVITILAIGASSQGGRDAAAGGYFGIIERELEKLVPGLDIRIVDRGVSGELAANAAKRLVSEVALVNPDVVLWQVGTHDALQQVPVAAFTKTVATTIDWLKAHDVDVIVVGLHFLRVLAGDPHYQTIRASLERVANAKNVLRIGRYEAAQVIEKVLQSDRGSVPDAFNLTEVGYSCLSEYVVRALATGVFARKR